MFGALKSGFRSLATLKLVVNVVGEFYAEKNSCGIARFPCDSTVFLSLLEYRCVLPINSHIFLGNVHYTKFCEDDI